MSHSSLSSRTPAEVEENIPLSPLADSDSSPSDHSSMPSYPNISGRKSSQELAISGYKKALNWVQSQVEVPESSRPDGDEPTTTDENDSSNDATQPPDVVIDIVREEPDAKDDDTTAPPAGSKKGRQRRRAVVGSTKHKTQEELLEDGDFMDAPSVIQAASIRLFTTTLRDKKQFLDRMRSDVRTTKEMPSLLKRIRWNISIAFDHLKHDLVSFRNSLGLWSHHLKVIEGQFGTGVTSYFRFLRTLFYLNIFVVILIISFVTIPQLLFRLFQQEPGGYAVNSPFMAEDFFTGGGWFKQTELYYGYHHNGTISIILDWGYDMRFAYVLTCMAYYIITVIMLAVFLARSYRQHYIDESSATSNLCVVKVFCGWDHKVSAADAATIQHNTMYKDLQEYLSLYHSNTDELTCKNKCILVTIRIVANIFILGILGAAGYLIYYLSTNHSFDDTDSGIFSEMALPLCLSAINLILPFGISIISHFENYQNPRVKLMLTMTRTIVLNIVTLGVLLYFWYTSVDCRNNVDEAGSIPCETCWENFMGEQLYRLIIFDFIFTLGITFFSEFVRRLVIQRFNKNRDLTEFNIGRNTLNLIYSQILVWLGTFYSPLLCVIHMIKLILIFYLKRVSVVQNCAPPSRAWRAGQTSTFIQFLLFVSCLATFVGVVYGIFFIPPSHECGPYQMHNTTYQIWEELLEQWEAMESGNVLKSIFEIFTSMAFLAFLLIGLGVASHYSRIVAHAKEENLKNLRHQIQMGGKDKKFLLKLLYEARGRRSGSLTPGETPSRIEENIHIEKTLKALQRLTVTSNNINPRRQRLSTGATTYHPSSSSIETQDIEPAGQSTSQHVYEAQNPTYRPDSPNRLPDLPYPTHRYNTIRT